MGAEVCMCCNYAGGEHAGSLCHSSICEGALLCDGSATKEASFPVDIE